MTPLSAGGPSWMEHLDDGLYLVLVLLLPALAKLGQWIRDTHAGKSSQQDDEELTRDLSESPPLQPPVNSAKKDSLPQPFEAFTTQSSRMENVKQPAQPPATARPWQPRTSTIESRPPNPSRIQPPVQPPLPRSSQQPRRPSTTAQPPVSRRKAEEARPQRSAERKQEALRDLVDIIGRKPSPKPQERPSDRAATDEQPPARKKTVQAATVAQPIKRPDVSSTQHSVLANLDPHTLRQAFILREILNPPLSLRRHHDL